MTDLLDQAVEAMRQMPPATQDSMAQAILTIMQDTVPIAIDDEHLPYVVEGLAQIKRGEFAGGEASGIVAAAFRRHKP